jgi:hypothetical protein
MNYDKIRHMIHDYKENITGDVTSIDQIIDEIANQINVRERKTFLGSENRKHILQFGQETFDFYYEMFEAEFNEDRLINRIDVDAPVYVDDIEIILFNMSLIEQGSIHRSITIKFCSYLESKDWFINYEN